jgi:hypothetical protein
MYDLERRMTDGELREALISPMVATEETDAAIALRFEVTRARREETALRSRIAEAERERDEAKAAASDAAYRRERSDDALDRTAGERDAALARVAELEEAGRELAAIDARLQRRATLDGLTRLQKIELALRVCEETDPKGEVAARYVATAAKGTT